MRCHKTIDVEILLEVSEKIYVPLFHVQIDNVFCGKFHVTDQEFHNEALLGIIHCNSSYMFRILFVCFISCQADNLINEYIRMSIVGQFALFYVLIEQVVLLPDYDEYLDAVPKIQQERGNYPILTAIVW